VNVVKELQWKLDSLNDSHEYAKAVYTEAIKRIRLLEERARIADEQELRMSQKLAKERERYGGVTPALAWEREENKRLNTQLSELVQKVEDLRVRLGEKMEKDAQGPDIMPMAEAKRPKEVAT